MKRWIIVGVWSMMVSLGFAQGSEPASQVSLLQLNKTGGWAMWPLGGFSIFMVTLIIQNFMNLRPKVLLHNEQMPALLEMMMERR